MNRKPQHIALVSIDTLRTDCINASPTAGKFREKYKVNYKLNTEELDELLKNGLFFNNCISAAPYTSASHAAYFTGCWPKNNGVYEFFNRKLNKPTIFEYAKQLGYTTIFQTDFPIILGYPLGFDKGIDFYYIENELLAFDKLLNNKDRNTLSLFHFGGVHYPYGFHKLKFGSDDYIRKVEFLEKKYKVNKNYKLRDILDESFRSADDKKMLFRYKSIVEKLYKEGLYNDLFLLYLEGINYFLKNRFNRFINNIKNFIDNNDALLIIFSDHGEAWDKETYGHHNSLSDEVLRVPLFFYGNNIKKGTREDLTRTIDLAPTLIRLLRDFNFKKINMDGVDLKIFRKGKENKRKYAIAQTWGNIIKNFDELIKYQNKLLKEEKSRPIKTFLESEMAYDGKYKFMRYFNHKGILLKESFLEKKDEAFKKSLNNSKKKMLISILENYNNFKDITRNKTIKVTNNIKEELQNLGYRI